MRKLAIISITLVLGMFLTGCGLVSHTSLNQGTEITDEQIAKIKPGMSKQDVITAIGMPTKVHELEGNKVWFYCWQRGGRTSVLWGTFGSDSAKSTCVSVIFDKEGKVLRVGKGRGAGAEITPTFKVKHEQVKEPEKPQTW